MTADEIGHCLARNLFKTDLVAVDRCLWTGNECDLLVVTPRLQVIDVEVKISRADLKADRKKDKWLEPYNWQIHGWDRKAKDRAPVEWPQRVWKHYYAVPESLWKPELLEFCNPRSGVITVKPHATVERGPEWWHHRVIKRAKPNPAYEPISATDLRKIAFLASARMWSAYEDQHRARLDYKAQLALARGAA